MFLLFHILIPFIIVEGYSRAFHKSYHRIYLIIGSLIADFDKILSVLHISSGRGFCHTILFNIIFIVSAFLISRKDKKKYLPFAFGCIVHLILDLPNIPLFWPFFSSQYNMLTHTNYNLFEYIGYFIDLMLKPKVLITETIGAIVLSSFGTYILIRKRGIIKNETNI